jgi:hypothetical protein
MALLTLLTLPACTVICGAVALAGIALDDDDLATLASLHMVIMALAQVACWFVI